MLKLFHTVRHLKPIQVINRISRKFTKPKLWTGDIPSSMPASCSWQAIANLPSTLVGDDTACFLNEEGPLYEWHNANKSHLWLYNLHYFDDLLAEGTQQRSHAHGQLITHWLAANPPATGVGWEPYPTSLRIVNWVQWLLLGNPPVPGMLASLYQQTHVLNQQLEYHLQGNHLLANAKALVFAGSFFEGPVAEEWLQKGLALLDRQHREQLLADGAHFELSPMYHCIILMDILDLIQLGQCYPNGVLSRSVHSLTESASAMLLWLKGMLHPDGDIPFFNDATLAIAPSPAAIFDYAGVLGVACASEKAAKHYYQPSGYIALRDDAQTALLDVAAIGPDTIPGHAHADTLSFEWSLYGQRVLVNSGISEYGLSAERLRQRGTAAHNTVVVNGQDSTEVWSGFRVARRARPFDVQLTELPDYTKVIASHSGYHRLKPKVTHTREWQIQPGSLLIKDSLLGACDKAVAYLHIHPDVAVTENRAGAYTLTLTDGRSCEMRFKHGRASLEDSTWHPEFGLSQPNKRIAILFEEQTLETEISF
ncbi:MAG: alginate lyase family protein [Porticoccaceae bacterium]|nr:alginate lyase family protein [Porticoccaceae bacterium]